MNSNDAIRAMITKMWGENTKILTESCDETYANTPVRIFREYFQHAFGSVNVDALDTAKVETCDEFLHDYRKDAAWEADAWEATKALLEQHNEIMERQKHGANFQRLFC